MMLAQTGAPLVTSEMPRPLPVAAGNTPDDAPAPGFQTVFEELETAGEIGAFPAEPGAIADAAPSDDAPAPDMVADPDSVPDAPEGASDTGPEVTQAEREAMRAMPIPTQGFERAAMREPLRDRPEPMQHPLSDRAGSANTARPERETGLPSLSPMPPPTFGASASANLPSDAPTTPATTPDRLAAPVAAFRRAAPAGENTAAHPSSDMAHPSGNATDSDPAYPPRQAAQAATDGDRPASTLMQAQPAPGQLPQQATHAATHMDRPASAPTLPSQLTLPEAQPVPPAQPDTRLTPRDPCAIPPAPPFPGISDDPAIAPLLRNETPRTAPRDAPRSIDASPQLRATAASASALPSPQRALQPAQSTPWDEPLQFVSDTGQNHDPRLAADGVAPLRASVEILQHPDLPRHVATQISAAVQRAIPVSGGLGGSGGGMAGAIAGAGAPVIELTLNPAELGRVRISMIPGDGAITVTVTAERPETLDLMRRHADMLAQDFRHLGFGSAEFAFGRNSRQSGGTGAPDRATDPEDPRPPSIAAAPVPTALRIAADRVDIRV